MKQRHFVLRAIAITSLILQLFLMTSAAALAAACPSPMPYKVFLPLIIGGSGNSAGVDFSGGWRLPFDSTTTITDGPGEEFHTGASAEAIDYAMNSASFPVLAPADGVVLDVKQDLQSTFGWVIRINHNNLFSFFAHLDADKIFVGAGQRVTQGQCIAMSSKSGLPPTAGIHLHYEARTGAVVGNIFSGQSVPIRHVPGTWWNPWYSPTPDFRNDPARPSGGAQFPEMRISPATVDLAARHLANTTAPPNAVNAYLSDISGPSPAGLITVHLAASPNTPTNNSYKTLFSIYKWQPNPDRWQGLASTYSPSLDDFLSFQNQSYGTGQHTYLIQANTADLSQFTCYVNCDRHIELFSDGYQGTPHIVASYTRGSDATTLEYCASGAIHYEVYEYHGGATALAYSGPDCMILVHRILGSTNWYYARALYSDSWPTPGWAPPTPWLIVHN